ncbi:hypothetical protein JB92DRAFT_2900910 [Gautieria morchelliformis]|nr:hypothetical protein JB92DRAFT_2900910 [Gautieria morchelliformis]
MRETMKELQTLCILPKLYGISVKGTFAAFHEQQSANIKPPIEGWNHDLLIPEGEAKLLEDFEKVKQMIVAEGLAKRLKWTCLSLPEPSVERIVRSPIWNRAQVLQQLPHVPRNNV